MRLFGRALATRRTGEAFRRLMELEIGRAEQFYAEGRGCWIGCIRPGGGFSA